MTLSENAQKIVENSLQRIEPNAQLSTVETVVKLQVGELSLSLKGEQRASVVHQALIEIAQAYVWSKVSEAKEANVKAA